MDYPNFKFDVIKQDGATGARLGEIHTPHGVIETPAFVFCGTKANVKMALPEQVKALGAQIMLSNTYHLLVQPGPDLIQKMGGLHKFCGWDGPMLTDSGGFQIFSLNHGGIANEIKGKGGPIKKSLLKITEEGAAFRSYLGGERITVTPESSVQAQVKIGADLIVTLDELTAFHDSRDYTARSLQRSHRWEKRSLEEFKRHHNGTQALYAVVQGGVYEDLRHEAADFLNSEPFFGHAIGGCLGDTHDSVVEIAGYALSRLDKKRPIHLLGMGAVPDVWNNVAQGIDTFDCVSPTRLARHGVALSKYAPGYRIKITNAQYREDPNPLDETVDCDASRNFSRAYLHHLFRAKEMLGMQILTLHNIAFMVGMMKEVRAAIREDRFEETRKDWLQMHRETQAA